MDRVAGVTLAGTEGAGFPFWSPDGRRVGFFADDTLKIVDISGGAPQTVTDADAGRGGTWNRDGVILFARGADGPLFRVSASGGQAVAATALDTSRGETAHRQPRFLPDGVHFLYHVASSKPEHAGVHVGALDSREVKRLLASDTQAEFAPPDLLLFLRGSLMAQRFDTSRLELVGEPFRVAEGVGGNPGVSLAGFSVSGNGVLVHRPGAVSGDRELAFFSSAGAVEERVGVPGRYTNPDLSPDGTRLAVFKWIAEGQGDIWIRDLRRSTETRFTFDPFIDDVPVWSPDGTQIAFVSNRNGGVFNLYLKSANGTGEDQLLLETPNNKTINDWSSDGRYILYEEDNPDTKTDLWVLPLFGDRKPVRVLATSFVEDRASFSPDGRWIAYSSDESGRFQVYVQGFPEPFGKWQASTTAVGTSPRWRPDGTELLWDVGGALWAVDLTGTVAGKEFRAGTPRQVLNGLAGAMTHNLDITPDGKRFLLVTTPTVTTGGAPIVVVVNWQRGLTH